MNTGTVDFASLASACQAGDRRAAARLISCLESPQTSEPAARAVESFARPAQTIGITGPPGAGKSTLAEYLALLFRERGENVAILAVDPSSPFTGGALLGDRIRMDALRNDPHVFIRSMGSRGAVGGLAAAVSDTLRVLAAAGYGRVLLETVGAGQSETAVAHLADSVCVVQVPGLGDDVQLMKMGILEIADLFVVNKSDRPGAEDLKIQIELALQSVPGEVCRTLRMLKGERAAAEPRGGGSSGWMPPVVLASALNRAGGAEILKALDAHRTYVSDPRLAKPLAALRLRDELLSRATRRFRAELGVRLASDASAALLERCLNGTLSRETALESLLKERGP